MNLKEEIRELQRERTMALRTAQFQFARTRRDVRKAVSPQRFFHRHMWSVLGAATLAGLWIAPQTSRRARSRSEAPAQTSAPRPSKIQRGARVLMRKLFPFLGGVVPTESGVDGAPAPHHLIGHILKAVLPTLLVELERSGSFKHWVNKALHREPPPEDKDHEAAEAPPVVGADTEGHPADQPLDPVSPV